MIPTKSKIFPNDLHDKSVQFEIESTEGRIQGLGVFKAERNANGFDYIDLLHQHSNQCSVIYPLSQELVDAIQIHPDPKASDFCLITKSVLGKG